MTESLPLLPEASSPRRCRCGRPVPKGRLIQGWGSGCAVEHGVAPAPTPRVTTVRQEGESLLDLLRVDAHRVSGNPGMEECSELRGGGESVSDINDMIEWLGGVLDRREDTTNDAGRHDGQWKRDGLASVVDAAGRPVVFSDRGLTAPEQADHIALNGPKQILADVAADRTVIAMYETAAGQVAHARAKGWQHDITQAAAVAYLDVVRVTAAKYAAWPGYQQSWAPEANRG